VNVVNSMIFAGMSGAAVADAAGIGMVELEAMTKRASPTFRRGGHGRFFHHRPHHSPSIPS